jgi:D-sedoheptulose 7-phosphate isomerase
MEKIKRIITESLEVKRKLLDECVEAIRETADAVSGTLKRKGGFYLFGNGGSAADAQHIACELQGRFLMERAAIPVVSFTTNTSTLTAVANDYGYDKVFSRQVDAFVKKGDVVLGISTSGNSPNVIEALSLARERGTVTIGFTGEGGGKMAELCDILLAVPSRSTPRIQEAHILAGHIVCELVEEALFGKVKG